VSGASTAPACAGEPLSWLALERHALGELPPAEAARVVAHLAACAACAACAAETRRPWASAAPPRAPWWRRYVAAWATTAALAGAAAAFLLMARTERPDPGPMARQDTLAGVKGGDVALELVRERQGTITHGADTFVTDDRWKALLTCPASRMLFWDLVVRDGEGRSPRYPLRPSSPITCGNHVPLPGAFRLSGAGDARVCVLLGEDPVPRDRASGPSVCASVHPEK